MTHIRKHSIHLKTATGKIVIDSVYGQDPDTKEYFCPVRADWGIDSRQEMSPVLEDRICFTATYTGSYKSASEVAEKWGVPVDDSTIHMHVQKTGKKAEQLSEERVEIALDPGKRSTVIEQSKKENGCSKFSLIIEMDAWMIRERGVDWGMKPPEKTGVRVSWHEMKTAVIFRLDHRVENQSGRREIIEKYMVAYRGDPYEFGKRVFAEALRRGLNQAEQVYIIADGAVWIWNIVEDRFSDAMGVLDYYHASQHLWGCGAAIYGDHKRVKEWVLPKLLRFKQGKISHVLRAIQYAIKRCRSSEDRKILERELNYFSRHKEHANYKEMKESNCPIGSGAVESACSQLQNRFKRTGQFWTLKGDRALMYLDIARRNHDWDEIWEDAA